jgi:hypothetical protein
MNSRDVEKLITELKMPSKVTQDLLNVVKSLLAYTKTLPAEIEQLNLHTKPPGKPLMSSLLSTKTPDEQNSEKLLLDTLHRDIREISNIECNAIISNISTIHQMPRALASLTFFDCRVEYFGLGRSLST